MNIAVYCGSKFGDNPAYKQSAVDLGTWIGKNNYGLCYGGASNGLMGVVADATLASKGDVIGVVPRSLRDIEDWHPGLTELIEVESLTERKQVMADHSDAYLALPGGPGTLEEISEMISWSRVNFHHKPCIILNVDGFYDPFEQFIRSMVTHEFITDEDIQLVHFITNIQELDQILA